MEITKIIPRPLSFWDDGKNTTLKEYQLKKLIPLSERYPKRFRPSKRWSNINSITPDVKVVNIHTGQVATAHYIHSYPGGPKPRWSFASGYHSFEITHWYPKK